VSQISVNKNTAVAAAIGISVISAGGFLILPLFVGAAAQKFSLSEQQIGFFASSVMAGTAISAVLAIFWVRRIDWQKSAFAALSLLLVAHTLSLFSSTVGQLVFLQVLASVGGGAAYSLALTTLSDNRNPDRCFGLAIAVQVLFQVLGLLLLPNFIETNDLQPVLILLATMAALGIFILRWLPRSGRATSQKSQGGTVLKPAVVLSLLGCFMFFFNVGVVWSFIERMAALEGFGAAAIGRSLAIGVAFGIPGALLASWSGERFGRIGPLALGAATILTALYLLQGGMTSTDFLAAIILYNFGWNYSLPFQYAAVNAADASGKCVSITPAFHGAGAAIGPSVAAFYVTAESYTAVSVVAAIAVALSVVLFIWALLPSANRPGDNLPRPT
jgi:predicted MFS family arabinose efflux permease